MGHGMKAQKNKHNIVNKIKPVMGQDKKNQQFNKK